MSNKIKKTAKGRILAAAVLLAGVCGIAAAAWATTCFLPTGNCSTGKVDYHEPNPTDECKDFDGNTSKTDYEWKSKTSCFKCTACTSNGTTKYNCVNNSGYSWDSSDGGHCCVSGEKWYSKMGMCCSATSGCTCPTLQKWENGECVCQHKQTDDGTCCKENETAGATLCCPKPKVEQNRECVCDDQHDNDGKGGCIPKPKDDDNITVKFQYTCNGGACSSDVTKNIIYEFNDSKIGNNISGTTIAKTDWKGYNELNWFLDEEKPLFDRTKPYGCSYGGDDCGRENSGRNGYANDVCNTQGVRTYTLDYHDFDFVSDADVISNNTVADIKLYLLKDENTGKYSYLLNNEFWDTNNNICGAAGDYYDSCMFQHAHEVANNEVVLPIPLKGGERCAALDGDKYIYYVVNCPYDTNDCIDPQYPPQYTITESGDSSKKGSTGFMELMQDGNLQVKFNSPQMKSSKPKNNKIVYYSKLQKWDEVTVKATNSTATGYAFGMNQCKPAHTATASYPAGPDAEQIVSVNMKGYVTVAGHAQFDGTNVKAQLYIRGRLLTKLTISDQSFTVNYNCEGQTDYNDSVNFSNSAETILPATTYSAGPAYTTASGTVRCSEAAGSNRTMISGSNMTHPSCEEIHNNGYEQYGILCAANNFQCSEW